MTADTTFPFGFLKSNLELHLRTAQLLHEHWQRWLDLSRRVSQEGIAEYKAEIDDLGQRQSWRTFATLPAEAFWRQLQQRFVDTQNGAQLAIEAQAAFTQGLQQAAQEWQKSTLGGVDPSTTKLPFFEFFKNWNTNWNTAVATATSGAARAS